MRKELADFLISFLDLIEAEAALARRMMGLFALAMMLGMAGGLIGVGAVGLLTWTLYLFLERGMGQPEALLICSLILIIIAGLSLWGAKRILR